MEHVLLQFPQRGAAIPWYRNRTLFASTADEPLVYTDIDCSGRAVDVVTSDLFERFLPSEIFVPADYVHAVLTTHIWWGKPINVSWMHMDYDLVRGCEVPTQHHAQEVIVIHIEHGGAGFVVAEPAVFETMRIATDCVTDIAVVPFPEPHRVPGCQIDC